MMYIYVMRITISLNDKEFEELSGASIKNERSVSGEARYRIINYVHQNASNLQQITSKSKPLIDYSGWEIMMNPDGNYKPYLCDNDDVQCIVIQNPAKPWMTKKVFKTDELFNLFVKNE